MLVAHRVVCSGLALTLLAIANTCPALADEDARSYLAAYELQTPSGSERASETLSVRRANATSFVSVSDTNGALLSLPTQFAADGEILANSFDPSVTCYNMAAAALYANERAPAEPAPVFVRLGDNTVAVPLTLKATNSRAGSRSLVGKGATAFTLSSDTAQLPGGMVVDARIDVVGGTLTDVVFEEATLVGSPARPISRMTCSLKQASGQAPRTAAPALSPGAVLPG